MLNTDIDTKINAIVDFLKNTKKADYSITSPSILSENSISIPVYSTGEMLSIITTVNYKIMYKFFEFNDFEKLNIEPAKPIHLLIKSVN